MSYGQITIKERYGIELELREKQSLKKIAPSCAAFITKRFIGISERIEKQGENFTTIYGVKARNTGRSME